MIESFLESYWSGASDRAAGVPAVTETHKWVRSAWHKFQSLMADPIILDRLHSIQTCSKVAGIRKKILRSAPVMCEGEQFFSYWQIALLWRYVAQLFHVRFHQQLLHWKATIFSWISSHCSIGKLQSSLGFQAIDRQGNAVCVLNMKMTYTLVVVFTNETAGQIVQGLIENFWTMVMSFDTCAVSSRRAWCEVQQQCVN